VARTKAWWRRGWSACGRILWYLLLRLVRPGYCTERMPDVALPEAWFEARDFPPYATISDHASQGEVVLIELNPFDGVCLGTFPASTGLFLWDDPADRKIMTGEVRSCD